MNINRDLYNILNKTNNKQVILASYSMSVPFLVRLGKLLELEERILNGSYRLILIQIQEAHSKYWPTGMSDHPDPTNI